ncbi:MAG: Filamentation induced by cAMP protein Fic [Candidatus Berkelbacteria bacterium Licking1014_7]|uniref:Filamentation induced by cAMP protein Fic n=1 Tax=Candidatus Berkelbacteria bacterium Licking1014_7 TaxID=2017147 RepID=A0A554LI28_9BACT|nr:MAG: Filamentation induced by cAMP protein Fic [Candidatus Berkelbacteria bacterium Licking1014_7]
MTYSQKLQLILQLSGLTQEKLAAKIVVSFATLNSWLNKRSEPRAKAQEKIDDLYREYSGEKTIPKNILKAKKTQILQKSKKYPNIINTIMSIPDIYQEFQLALTYHSNSIEGSMLTRVETAHILFDNALFPNRSLIEHLEAKNHQTALRFLFDYLALKHPLDEKLILKLHGILLNGINSEAGFYRRAEARIVGSNIPTANYVKIPYLMGKLSKRIANNNKDIVAKSTKIHSEFEKIHPFSDGNGRIGRLLLVAMLLKQNLPPAIIRQEDKPKYLRYLNISQTKDDFSLWGEFLCDSILLGFDILERKI